LLKDVGYNGLVDTIRAVHRGEKRVPPEVAAKLAETMAHPKLTRVSSTPCRLIVAGMSNQEIASRLNITRERSKPTSRRFSPSWALVIELRPRRSPLKRDWFAVPNDENQNRRGRSILRSAPIRASKTVHPGRYHRKTVPKRNFAGSRRPADFVAPRCRAGVFRGVKIDARRPGPVGSIRIRREQRRQPANAG